jgi:hypothetical protein
MLVACWSAKGGSGSTSIAASLAVIAADSGQVPLAVDLGGDLASVFGSAAPAGPDLHQWLEAAPDVGADTLHRVVTDLGGIDLLTAQPHSTASPGRIADLVTWLKQLDRPVIADVGCVDTALAHALVDQADRPLLVTRLCYLSLRRAIASPRAATGVVVIREKRRAITQLDVEQSLDLPVVAVVDVTAAMSRVIDSGQLPHHLPAYVRRALRHAA